MRSMDSILSDEPSLDKLPVTASDSQPSESVSGDGPSAPAPKAAAPDSKPEAKPAVTAKASVADDEEEGDPDPADASTTGLRKALTAVRGDKRKARAQWREAEARAAEAERKMALLEGQIAAFNQIHPKPVAPQQQPAQADELPDFFLKPEEYISQREKRIRDELKQVEFKVRADIDEAHVSEQHDDYNQAKAAFIAATQQQPWLWQAMMQQTRPARYVYQEGKKMLGGGASESEAKLKAELEQLRAEVSQLKSKPAPLSPPKPSTASARGNGSSASGTWSGPRSLEEILG
jgi:DNA segregation ATPase FtsK/SpoIIIE-like protein